jgi:hypothetical protein
MRRFNDDGIVELQWHTDTRGVVLYALYWRNGDGQLVLESTMEQGPFDTGLEVAQWAWRAIARLVPPSSP